MIQKIKNMWKYRNGCPKDESLESIDWSMLDVRLQKIYENGYKEINIISDDKFCIFFRINNLNQLSNFVLNNNITEILGFGWELSAVNKTLDGNLVIWYER